MPLTKYTASTAIIAALSDLPNATSGLTAAQLKAKFDENPEAFKVFVNSTLTAEIDALIASVAAGTGLSDGAVTNAKLALNAVTSDKIVDGTIVNADINAAAAIDGSKLANLSITSSQIADGAIVNADINASASIDASKIGTGVVSNAEFSYLDGVTQSIQTQINGVVLGSIPDGSLTDVKLSADPADIKARLTAHLAETMLYLYKKDVTAVDADGNPTVVEYRRADNTLANKRTASNPDVNGFYQTVVEQFYNTSVVLYKTVTYTFTFLANGIIDTSNGGVTT